MTLTRQAPAGGEEAEPASSRGGERDPDALIPAAPWVEQLVAAIGVAREGEDPEGVHQLRIAIARLRVWLALGGWRVLEDDLHWLRDRAAPLRDLDVHLGQAPPRAIAEKLRTERVIARGDLLRALEHPRLAGLLRAFEVMPPLERRAARRATGRLAREAVRRGRRAMDRPEDLAALHALRRAVRRVRFALEWLGKCPRSVVDLQDVLGLVGDRIVALRQFDRLADEPSRADSYGRLLKDQLRKGVRRARRKWQRSRVVLEDASRWTSS